MRTIHKNAHKDLSLCCELVVVQCGTIYASFVKPWCFAHKQFVLNEQVSVIWHDQEQPSASCGISAFYKWPSLLLVYGKAITGLIFVTDLSSSIKLLFNLNSCSTHWAVRALLQPFQSWTTQTIWRIIVRQKMTSNVCKTKGKIKTVSSTGRTALTRLCVRACAGLVFCKRGKVRRKH